MSVNKQQYICSNCYTKYSKWLGKCEICESWNTIEILENTHSSIPSKKKLSGKQLANPMVEFYSITADTKPLPRILTANQEFDRACGGGLVLGSTLLIGGEPGIGKSTLLMQVIFKMSERNYCIYVSGEESVDQVSGRAIRLGVQPNHNLKITSHNELNEILHSLLMGKTLPNLLIIDSIQTVYLNNIDGIMGSVSQIKACEHELISFCKKNSIILIIVGHVTREGNIAGPKTLEHMLDTVLYFEGDKSSDFRILRAVKNRFGASDEIGIFEMNDTGLSEVQNPSLVFFNADMGNTVGSSLFASIEGLRPIIVELQSLLLNNNYTPNKRYVVGTESNRLSMITAILEARCNIPFYNKDIYLNIIGGIKITDPAIDLAIASSLLSSFFDIILPNNPILLGELALSGQVRKVRNLDKRLQEAQRLGFSHAIVPFNNEKVSNSKLKINYINNIQDLVKLIKS